MLAHVIIKVAFNQDRHKSSDDFDFGLDQTTHFGVTSLEWRKFYALELEYLWGQLANLDQILYVASLGVGKGCIMFWGRLDQNCGVHGNRKPPLTYNGENGVSTASRLVAFDLILFILAGNEDRHKISDKFEFRADRTTDYGVTCPLGLKNFP